MDFECISALKLSSKRWRVDGPIMVMPYTDESLASQAGALASRRSSAKGLLLGIHDQARQGFVACVNQAFAASESAWFGYMAQDAFAGRDWMALALQALHKQRAVLLGFNDGKWHGALASFGLASRSWALANYADGAFFYSHYLRHYADTELTVLAHQVGGYVYQPDSVLIEVDWAKDASPVHVPDRAMYQQRITSGFEGKVTDPRLLAMFA
jgi:hypothetical protein